MVRVWLSVNLKRHGVDCGRTVGRIGPGTRAERSRMWRSFGTRIDIWPRSSCRRRWSSRRGRPTPRGRRALAGWPHRRGVTNPVRATGPRCGRSAPRVVSSPCPG